LPPLPLFGGGPAAAAARCRTRQWPTDASTPPRLLPSSPAAGWAATRLQRSGRCHESEVFGAYRRARPKYRGETGAEALPDALLRDLIRNYHPNLERTRTGYLKNLSLLPAVDAFGVASGAPPPARPVAAAGAGAAAAAQEGGGEDGAGGGAV
jgi:hypothetical protein